MDRIIKEHISHLKALCENMVLEIDLVHYNHLSKAKEK